MTDKEKQSLVGTIRMLMSLAYNIHGVMDVIDHNNCEKIIKLINSQPCEDCISRAEALKHSHIEYDDDGEGHKVVYAEDIEGLPSVTPQPKRGKWIENTYESSREFWDRTTECSECGYKLGGAMPNYCPNCGSYNREEADE